MAKNVLICEPEYDFEVISIVSSLKDYRLCWLLNSRLGFDFVRKDDLEAPLPRKKKNGYFNLYRHYDDIDKMNYFLIANRFEGNALLNELKMVDYIIKLDGYLSEELKPDLISEIKNMPFIDAVFDTQLHELKNKTNLLF